MRIVIALSALLLLSGCWWFAPPGQRMQNWGDVSNGTGYQGGQSHQGGSSSSSSSSFGAPPGWGS